uniref:Uncharacterized protein n=1 Tax=Nelumbo nucifera TaxID=4432 RepID=A0A822ZF32_NELNU|nr:TPA_asm: hypothetical protein HUJ06_000591 [Nelumbo nucifera]
MQHLTALGELEIGNCSEPCSLEGIQGLTALKKLTIENLPKLQGLPQQ